MKRVIISLFTMAYISFLLFVFGIKTTNFIKWLLIAIGAVSVIVAYVLVIKKFTHYNKPKEEISEERKKVIMGKINRIKKIISFLFYSCMVILIILGLSNDGEFIVKNFYPFFQKRVSDNDIFNWIIILSPLCYIASIYNIYYGILKMVTDKYDLSEKTKE